MPPAARRRPSDAFAAFAAWVRRALDPAPQTGRETAASATAPPAPIGERATPGILRDPKLVRLLELWDDKRGTRPMPARGDFGLRDVAGLTPDIAWLKIERPAPGRTRFRAVRVGENISFFYGDSTGKYLDEDLKGNLRDVSLAHLSFAAECGYPLHFLGRVPADAYRFLERELLTLPLGDEGSPADHLLVGLVFSEGA